MVVNMSTIPTTSVHTPLTTGKIHIRYTQMMGYQVFTVVGLYRVRSKVRVSVSYDFMDFLLTVCCFYCLFGANVCVYQMWIFPVINGIIHPHP